MVFTLKGKKELRADFLKSSKKEREEELGNKGGSFLENFRDDIKVIPFLPRRSVKHAYLMTTLISYERKLKITQEKSCTLSFCVFKEIGDVRFKHHKDWIVVFRGPW